MGKLKRSSVIKNSAKGKKKNIKLTLEQLLDNVSHLINLKNLVKIKKVSFLKAEECLDEFQLEQSYQFVRQALDIQPENLRALDIMGAVQLEMGNVESAKQVYQKLIEIAPNEGFNKYMCIAQLSDGLDAVHYYQKGIEIMISEYNKQEPEQAIANEEDDNEPRITKSDISTAFGSIAELYLTDLCMEEKANEACKLYLDKSLEYDPENPETLQLCASYWLSETNIDEARKCILKSLDLWLPKYIKADEEGFVDPSQVIPLTYDSRINTSRILTECDEYDKAIQVLEQLLDEDDEVVVVWYMLGWINELKGDDYKSTAKYYLKKADELATKIKYEQKYLDDQLRNHIKELLEKLKDVPSDDEDDNNEDDKENIDEEDVSEFEDVDDDDDNEKIADENDNYLDIKKTNKSKLKNVTDEPMEIT